MTLRMASSSATQSNEQDKIKVWREAGMFRILFAVLMCAAAASSAAGISNPDQTDSASKVRTYYIAARRGRLGLRPRRRQQNDGHEV